MGEFDLRVPALPVPRRIDAFLAFVLRDRYSRETIKAALKEGRVLLNGAPAKPSDFVRESDRITGEIPESSVPGIEACATPRPVPVVYEDEDILVIDKPAGWVVHPGAGRRSGTLSQALMARGHALSDLGGSFRPGIVHRLDKDTSGLLLVAKNNTAHRRLQEQFAARSLSKTYTALVRGAVPYEEGHVEAPIGRHPRIRRKMAAFGMAPRGAVTRYRVLLRFRRATLLTIQLLTGRTHQVRVHLAHLGHPVAGDPLYGTAKPDPRERLALHASAIEFAHPKDGRIMRFESPIPEAMAEMIRRAEAEGEI